MECQGGSDEYLEEEGSGSHNRRVTFSSLIIVLNSDQQETHLKGTENSSAERPDYSDSVSSSSSNSSIDDFIPINPQILLNSKEENNIPQASWGTKPPFENEKCNVASEAFCRVGKSSNDSPGSTSESSDITHESVTEYMFTTLSPSIQVMDSGEDVRREDKGTLDKPINDVEKAPGSNLADTNVRDSGDSSSAKCQIVTSNQPITSPKQKKSSSLLRHCPDCCPAFRCCQWPIHCIKRPGYSFKWFIQPGCSRNCLSWLICWCKLPRCQCPIWSKCCVKRNM